MTPLRVTLTLAILALISLEGAAQNNRLPKVEFDEASLDEIVEFFRRGGGIEGQATNILVDSTVNRDLKVTLKLHDVSLGVAFAYVAEIAGFDYRDEKHALRIFPLKGGKPPVRAFLKRGGPMTWRRASEMRLPKVEFDKTELGDVISDLTAASRRLDPKKKGLNIILSHGVDPATPVTFRLQNVPLSTVLKYVADFARLDLRSDGAAIVFMSRAKAGPKE